MGKGLAAVGIENNQPFIGHWLGLLNDAVKDCIKLKQCLMYLLEGVLKLVDFLKVLVN